MILEDFFGEKPLEYRMYCLVLRQLSPINKGIQASHCVLEYAHLYGDTDEYKDYFHNDKTLIMLDGGVSSDMTEIEFILNEYNIPFAKFNEPDLGELVTCICFLADERVWDKVIYPDFGDEHSFLSLGMNEGFRDYGEWCEFIGGDKNNILRGLLSSKSLSL